VYQSGVGQGRGTTVKKTLETPVLLVGHGFGIAADLPVGAHADRLPVHDAKPRVPYEFYEML
jgi:hypothetical protein